MSFVTWQADLISAQVDGAALSNTTTATSLLPAQAKLTLPANTLQYIGQIFRVRASGRISTLVTAPGTLTLQARFGGASIMDSGAMALNIVAKTNVGWNLELWGTLRVVGSAANFIWYGTWSSEAVIAAPLPTVGGTGSFDLPFNTAPVVGSNFDTTTNNVVDLFGTWSIANAANSITLHQFELTSNL